MTTEAPLIYTSKGNLPIDTLEYRTNWEYDKKNTKFIEEYYKDDELVKSTIYPYKKDCIEFTDINENIAEPLIYTINGNVPINSLKHKIIWKYNGNCIVLTDNYYSGRKLVKSSTHVYSKKPLIFASENGSLS